jgi:hypothetical protein
MLLPSIADRWGAQFHKYPLLTDRFEVRFTVNLKPSKTAPFGQAFAFWYVKENVTAAVPETLAFAGVDVGQRLEQSGFTLSGYRGRFEGVGVIFRYSPRPGISVVTNDGSEILSISDLATQFDFRKTPKLQVRVSFDTPKVSVAVKEGARWQEVAASGNYKISSGGFIGFTGVVEKEEVNADEVMIDDFTVENLDLRQKGEEAIVTAQEELEDFGNLLGDYGEIAEQKALRSLTGNIYRLISEVEEPKKMTMNTVKTLNSRLDAMDKAIEDLRTQLNAITGGDMEKDFVKMKEELLVHARKRKIPTTPNVSSKASKLKEKLTGNGTFFLGVICLAFVSICGFGLMMWRKVGNWQKKHIL